MTPQKELEINGSFFTHPLAELVTEIMQARLNGSLRASEKQKKWVIYFKAGKVVFAVSNARSSRFFDVLMRRKRLTEKEVAAIPNFSNDFELAGHLEAKKLLSKEECDQLFTEQVRAIVIDALSWQSGDWTFSSLARIRDGLEFEIDTRQLLIDYARCLPVETVLGRFRSLEESFTRSDASTGEINLDVDEAFVLSRAEETPLAAADLLKVSGMSEQRALHVIYVLWTGGLLVRKNWRPAFTVSQIAAIKGARLELKREAKLAGVTEAVVETPPEKPGLKPQEKVPEVIVSVEEYLQRVENAGTLYDVLGVDSDADIDELKRAYFRLARSFHPDRYHSEGGETLVRIQKAFTELAQAHETLKNEASREMYDYRMRKEIAEREKHRAAGTLGERDTKLEQAEEHFERGFSLLMNGDLETALPFLARAVHYAPNNARYHAYYGKALSADEKQRHKAESEMQAAIRIDPDSPTFRLLLAEFFVQQNLLKRAEGELNRLLAIFPGNREAQEMFENLKSS
jgi:curved DNA-binding protein CbpA